MVTLKQLAEKVTNKNWTYISISEKEENGNILSITFLDNPEQEVKQQLLDDGYYIKKSNGRIFCMAYNFSY